jgi:lipopolysaccharide export system protein LptC
VKIRGLLPLVLLVAAAVTGWSVWQHRPDDRGKGADTGRSNYVLTDFEAIVLDKQGHESFTVQAPRLVRDPGDETMTLETPVFYIPVAPAPGQAPTREAGWEVRSKSAWVSGSGEEVQLRGGVDMTSASNARQMKMTTEQLNVFPAKNRAVSPTTVTVTQPGSILRGQGMEALLDSKRVLFHSKVKLRYVPSPR